MTLFTNYDSSNFPTLEESINHASTNPFLLSNFHDKITVNFNNETYIISEPVASIKNYLNSFEPYFFNTDVLENERYRPESTSKRLYGTRDFWWLIMVLNGISSSIDFKVPNIKYLNPKELYRIEKFLIENNSNNITINL